jgi:hypothetical protein
MAVNLSPVGGVAAQFFTNTGAVLTGGKLYTYAAGTTTPAAAYTSSSGSSVWTNPIVLDAAGRVSGSGEIWLTDGINYKFVLKDSTDVLIATYDNISGINSNFVAYTNSQEIQTATSGQTVFTLTTMQYQVGTNSLSVFVDGVNQYGPGAQYAYTETSSTSVTFVNGLHVGAVVKFTSTQQQGAGAIAASQVSYTPAGTGAVTTNVQAKLRQTVSVEDFGAVGDGTTNDTAAIQAAINSLVSGQTLMFSQNYKITAALTITNKSRIRLSGKGRVFFSGAPSGDYIFTLVGTIDDLEIDSLTLEGDNNALYSQGAIGNNSGQTISNTRFHDLTIKNINVGISHNANLSGSYTNALCYNNYLENIKGTVSGSGYGIQAAKAYNLKIYGNTINNASRHSIYVGRGQNLGCLIQNNVIINHRKDVYDASIRAAIDCGRVSGVIISGNTFRDCYDGQIYLGADTSTGDDCADILIIGNKFGTPKNTVPCIWLGEQLVPTTNTMFKIDVLDNTFEQDCSITTAGVINLLNGTQITVKNNRLRAYSVAATLPSLIFIGDTRYITSDSQINDIIVSDNVGTSDKGSTVSGSRFLYIVDQLCTGSSRYTAKNNSCPTWASEYYFEATPVNLNSKLKFYSDIVYNIGSLAAGQNGTYEFTIDGCKPSSQVTSKMQYSLQVAPIPVYTFGASNSAVNTVYMSVANTNLTTATDQPSQTFRFFIEDF